jgi:hypothetical protein
MTINLITDPKLLSVIGFLLGVAVKYPKLFRTVIYRIVVAVAMVGIIAAVCYERAVPVALYAGVFWIACTLFLPANKVCKILKTLERDDRDNTFW